MGVKVGLIGAGAMGRRHLQALARDSRVDIVGVADTVADAAKTAAESVGAQPCRDLAALAGLGVDAVFVTLPNVYHGPVVLEALDRKLHVFSEKPMATTLEAGRQIRDQVRRNRRVYQMGFNRRWAPAYRFLRRHVEDGFVPFSANVKMNDGDMLTPAWFSDPKISGGFMYDTGIHLLDLVRWLLGPIQEVRCLTRSSCYPDQDDAVMLLRFTSGALVAFSSCGHATWTGPLERIEFYGDHTAIVTDGFERLTHTPGRDQPAVTQDFSAIPVPDRLGYAPEVRAFLQGITDGRPGGPTAEDAFRAVECVDACYRSAAAEGAPVRLA